MIQKSDMFTSWKRRDKTVPNYIKWYDPVCYQFTFYMLGKENEPWTSLEATAPFWDELMPYYQQWMDLRGRVIIESRSESGTLLHMATTVNKLCDAWSSIEQRSHMLNKYTIELVPDKTQTRFATSIRTIPKDWQQEVLQYTDMQKYELLNTSQKTAWLYQMLNCPTDDLEGICFPQYCFEPRQIPMSFCYEKFDYSQLLTFDIYKPNDEPQCMHYIHISLPRYMIKYANRSFDLQQKWEKRLLLLCGMSNSSFGYIKMDRGATEKVPPLVCGNGNFKLSFDSGVPDVAWGICLDRHQAEGIIQSNGQQDFSIFEKVMPLDKGHLYLQLTSDVSIVPQDKAKELWRLFSPQLIFNSHMINSITELPISFRLGADIANLQFKNAGIYQIIR